MTWIQFSNIHPLLPWSRDCILGTQQSVCSYGHLRHPAVTWPQLAMFLLETGIYFWFPMKNAPWWTMGSFYDCCIHLMIPTKRIIKSGVVTWWPALQPSWFGIQSTGSIMVIIWGYLYLEKNHWLAICRLLMSSKIITCCCSYCLLWAYIYVFTFFPKALDQWWRIF